MILSAADAALEPLLERFRSGAVGALARAISWTEDGHPAAGALLEAVHGDTGRAWRTGVTGPPGAGKSTLVDALAWHWSAAGRRLGLLAVDPSSPFTGGALLGDRVRMDRSTGERGIYVRSMASRGSLGGLSLATGAAADLMDAFGFEELLLETVGVGQAEIDIAAAADTTVVVLTPASGDGIQAMKAGLMEAADLFVVNKADTPGADRLVHEIEHTLDLRPAGAPRPPVLRCVARADEGVAALAEAIDARRAEDRAAGRLDERRRRRDLTRVRRVFSESLRAHLWEEDGLQDRAREALAAGERPDAAAQRLAAMVLRRFQEQA